MLKDNPGRKFKQHSVTEHREAVNVEAVELMVTNTRIEAGLSRADKDTKNEKKA